MSRYQNYSYTSTEVEATPVFDEQRNEFTVTVATTYRISRESMVDLRADLQNQKEAKLNYDPTAEVAAIDATLTPVAEAISTAETKDAQAINP